MLACEVESICALKDNYIFFWQDPRTESTFVVDPGEFRPIKQFLDKKGVPLNYILCTHHHPDHTGAVLRLQETYGCEVIGNQSDAHRIPGLTIPVKAGSPIEIDQMQLEVLPASGHTEGHVLYFLPEMNVLFSGDTIFNIGCGKIFEGSPLEMWNALMVTGQLAEDCQVYCGHEYTLDNIEFALSLGWKTEELKLYQNEMRNKRSQGLPTLPTTMGIQRRLNPFFQCDNLEFKQHLGYADLKAHEVLSRVRLRKDQWR